MKASENSYLYILCSALMQSCLNIFSSIFQEKTQESAIQNRWYVGIKTKNGQFPF